MKKKLLIVAMTALVLGSCKTPNVSYFNDLGDKQMETVNERPAIRMQPDDKISIVVKSRDAQLGNLFNLSVTCQTVGANSINSAPQQMSVYTIDSKGNIDFPIIGIIPVQGLSREEVAQTIKAQLISRHLVQDPVVTVEYVNLCFNVLGEVNRPGHYSIDREHPTLLDAISMAGDLTIQGERKNVLVIRNENGKKKTYRINLQNGKDVLHSPAFYLQQNDVIYVEPNNFRARQTTVNGNNVRSTSFWISIASLASSLAVLIYNIVN